MIEGTRVVHEVWYPHPPERVWRALTEPGELAAWLMPNDFVAREGARFRLDCRPAHDAPFECEVLELDPRRRMRARWIIEGQPAIVTFHLRADGEGTLLRVEHENLRPDHRTEFDGGWGHKLATDLALVLDGRRVPTDATRDGAGLTVHPALSSPPND